MGVAAPPRRTSVPGASSRGSALDPTPLRHVDWLLVGSTVVLAAFGVFMAYSASKVRLEATGQDPLYYLERQAMFAGAGLVAMLVMAAIDYRRLRDFWPLVYVPTVLVLAAVISPLGTTSKGTQGWFQIGTFQLQPSEFAKVALIVALAGYCNQHRGDLDAWRLATACALAAVPIGLVLAQPDFGTALVLGVIALVILVVGGVRGRHLVVVGLLATSAVGAAVVSGQVQEYQVDRLTAFINPEADPSGASYNQQNAQTAIGNGGWFGQGPFDGIQTNNGYVPEQHTDFIFSAVGEQFGFVGCAVLLALFGLVLWRVWRAALMASDGFGQLVCMGVLAMFTFQVFENVGMNLGIMPITGIPLPFLSHGGSSTIAAFAAIGLVVNVHMRRFS